MVRVNNYCDLMEVATNLGRVMDVLGKTYRQVILLDDGDIEGISNVKIELKNLRVDAFRITIAVDGLLGQIEKEDDR